MEIKLVIGIKVIKDMESIIRLSHFLKYTIIGCLILCFLYNIVVSMYYDVIRLYTLELLVTILLIVAILKNNILSFIFLITYVIVLLYFTYSSALDNKFAEKIYYALKFRILLDFIIDRQTINNHLFLKYLFWFFKGIYFYVCIYIVFFEIPLRIKRKIKKANNTAV